MPSPCPPPARPSILGVYSSQPGGEATPGLVFHSIVLGARRLQCDATLVVSGPSLWRITGYSVHTKKFCWLTAKRSVRKTLPILGPQDAPRSQSLRFNSKRRTSQKITTFSFPQPSFVFCFRLFPRVYGRPSGHKVRNALGDSVIRFAQPLETCLRSVCIYHNVE